LIVVEFLREFDFEINEQVAVFVWCLMERHTKTLHAH
jgi:hypothetical protein